RNFIKTSVLGAASIGFYQLYAMEPRLARFSGKRYCEQPAASIPVIAEVDVLVAGGSTGGVASAVSASKSGADVFLVGSLPYMGEDICGTYKYMFERNEDFESELGRKLFPSGETVYPMHVKTILEKELIDNNVDFLYSSFVSDVLFGDDGQPAGLVISNRTGRQAILCKSIIDCTPGAYVAKLAGGVFSEIHSDGEYSFSLISVGNNSESKPGVKVRDLPLPVEINGKKYNTRESEITIPLNEFSFASCSSAEQIIRDRTWDADQVDSADHISCTYPYRLKSQGACPGNLEDVSDIPLTAFIPEGMNNFFVLGSCIDASRKITGLIASPDNMIILGNILGKAAFKNPGNKIDPSTCSIRPVKGVEYLDGVAGEISETLRPNLGTGKVFCDVTALPVLGEYDVVVAGGGTAGAPAAISSARNGAKTLVVEYLHGLGGTGTLGMIGRYWYGHREGFTAEIDREVREMADTSHSRHKPRDHEWVKDWKMEWYRSEIRKAGGDIWFGIMVTGAFISEGIVKGILVSTPEGSGVILAKQVIDSTGSADIAIAAGADYEYTGKSTVAVQGSGLPKVDPDDHYNNTDWTFIDDSDVFDVTRVFISGKQKFPAAYDIGKLPQTRERRRVKAEFMVSPVDMLNARRYPDTISFHVSNFDTHGYTLHPYFIIKQPIGGHVTYDVDLPLRSLLPRGIDGVIVTGLGAGAHRDAMPVIRMQPCLQNQGYAVGCLAAKAVKENVSVRDVDIKSIQRHLVEIGNLPERVLSDYDNMPFTDKQLAESVDKIKNGFEGLEVLFSDMKKAIPLIENALRNSSEQKERLNLAITLGVLGIDDGWEILAEAVKAYTNWDEGWNFTGMGQFGLSMSFLDTIIIALGTSNREESLPAIIEKAEILTPEHEFSHFRAVSVAFEKIGNRAAAPVLFDLLNMEGVAGHHIITKTDAVRATVPSHVDVTLRNNVLRELHLARALYRCGDHYRLGRQILEKYANDLHGHYFRHAIGVMDLGFIM
ncbi:MAG: FAD-dependent oxidoreductase, partial [Bacteroidales bacterium]